MKWNWHMPPISVEKVDLIKELADITYGQLKTKYTCPMKQDCNQQWCFAFNGWWYPVKTFADRKTRYIKQK